MDCRHRIGGFFGGRRSSDGARPQVWKVDVVSGPAYDCGQRGGRRGTVLYHSRQVPPQQNPVCVLCVTDSLNRCLSVCS